MWRYFLIIFNEFVVFQTMFFYHNIHIVTHMSYRYKTNIIIGSRKNRCYCKKNLPLSTWLIAVVGQLNPNRFRLYSCPWYQSKVSNRYHPCRCHLRNVPHRLLFCSLSVLDRPTPSGIELGVGNWNFQLF